LIAGTDHFPLGSRIAIALGETAPSPAILTAVGSSSVEVMPAGEGPVSISVVSLNCGLMAILRP
jgi:hypothetical protein